MEDAYIYEDDVEFDVDTPSILPTPKKQQIKGPMDVYFTHSASDVVKTRKDDKLKQTTTSNSCKKELRDNACRAIARQTYDATIPFNAIQYPSVVVMVEVICQNGNGLKPPSYHEVQETFLKKEINDVKIPRKLIQEKWVIWVFYNGRWLDG